MQLEVGTIVEGKVTGFTSFGAFIDLGEGKKALYIFRRLLQIMLKKFPTILR